MDNLRQFLKDVGLPEDMIDQEHKDYNARTKRMKTAVLIGGGIAMIGYGVSKRNRKLGEAVMVAGALPGCLRALYNWSERDVAAENATDKFRDVVSELVDTVAELTSPDKPQNDNHLRFDA